MKLTAANETAKEVFETWPVPRALAKMAIPTIISQLIALVYNVADTWFIGQTDNPYMVAASALVLTVFLMTTGIANLFGVGGGSLVVRLLGRNDEDEAKKVASLSLVMAAAASLAFSILCFLFMNPLLRLLGASADTIGFARQYLMFVVVIGCLPTVLANTMSSMVRNIGYSREAGFGLGMGGILNVILDPVFIFGMDMGVAGASMATAISKLVSFAILIFPYLTRRSLLRLSPRLFRPDGAIVGQIVSVGSSSLFRNGLAVISAIVLNRIAGGISDSVLAGIGVSTKVMMFPFGVILGFGTGFQPVAGFNWGAKRFDRVEESYRFAARAAVAGAAVMGVLLAVFAEPLITLFAKTDPEMQAVGALAIRLQCLALPAHSWVAVVNMFCAGLGDARGALILSSSRQGTCFIPIVYPLAWLFGAVGVASVQAVADALSLVLAIPIVRKVMKRVKEAESQAAPETLPVREGGL